MNPRQAVLNAIPEKDLENTVRSIAIRNGWRFFHPFWMQRSEPGWPDCFMLRGERVVVAELKTERGKVTPAQEEWLAAFRKIPAIEVYVWRPSDRDAIEEVLS